MKKILSLTLAALMVVSMIPTAFAYSSEDQELGLENPQTTIFYDASQDDDIDDSNNDGVPDNQTYWEVTVPANMTPGTTAQVTVKGTWDSMHELQVFCIDNFILMDNDVTPENENFELGFTFPMFRVQGDDFSPISTSQDITVEEFNALFGEWQGRIVYTVELVDAPLS